MPSEIPSPSTGIARDGQVFHSKTILNFFDTEIERQNYIQLYNDIEYLNDLFGYAIWDFQAELENFIEYDDLSVSNWLNSGNYSQLIKDYINTENLNLFGSNNSEISMMFSIPGLYNNLPDTTTYNESNYYTFSNGFSDLANTISDSLSGRISLDSEIIEVSLNPDLSVLIKYMNNGVLDYITTKSLVFATPAWDIEPLVSSGFSEEVQIALSSINYNPLINANLFTSQRLWNKTWKVTFMDEFFVSLYDVVRSQTALNYNKESILGINIANTSTNNISLLTISDNDIMQNIFSGLEKYFPEIRSSVIGYDIQRYNNAFPKFTPEYYQIIKILNEDNSTFGPMFLTGDYLIHPSFEGVFKSARNVTTRILNFLDN